LGEGVQGVRTVPLGDPMKTCGVTWVTDIRAVGKGLIQVLWTWSGSLERETPCIQEVSLPEP
jgi:hypothetical protein